MANPTSLPNQPKQQPGYDQTPPAKRPNESNPTSPDIQPSQPSPTPHPAEPNKNQPTPKR